MPKLFSHATASTDTQFRAAIPPEIYSASSSQQYGPLIAPAHMHTESQGTSPTGVRSPCRFHGQYGNDSIASSLSGKRHAWKRDRRINDQVFVLYLERVPRILPGACRFEIIRRHVIPDWMARRETFTRRVHQVVRQWERRDLTDLPEQLHCLVFTANIWRGNVRQN